VTRVSEPGEWAIGRGESAIGRRKRAHLDAVLSGDVGFAGVTTGLERLRVTPRALPERDLDAVDMSVRVFGRRLSAPLVISCMTGGVSEAGPVNRALAAAAQEIGVAFGLGSGRALLVDPSAAASFAVRDVAPDVLLFANLGAVQLREYGVEACSELVGACGADALVLHLNAVQEALQPGGDTTFAGLLDRIGDVVRGLDVPVVVKEVGFGMSDADFAALVDAGVDGIDVAGAGGTNWARVEGHRDAQTGRVASAFAEWGRPTAECVRAARGIIDRRASETVLIGSGGIGDGVDALKALCLGADLAGMARGLLSAAAEGPVAATAAVRIWRRQLHIGMWAAGAGSPRDLGSDLLQDRS
jgi:isopentenyl-diphosphate delta-isomerase